MLKIKMEPFFFDKTFTFYLLEEANQESIFLNVLLTVSMLSLIALRNACSLTMITVLSVRSNIYIEFLSITHHFLFVSIHLMYDSHTLMIIAA